MKKIWLTTDGRPHDSILGAFSTQSKQGFSARPNGIIETSFESAAATGVAGDDVIAMIR